MDQKSIRFFFGPKRQEIIGQSGQSVLEALLKHEVAINHSCGGGASCGTCRIFVDALAPRNELESEFAEDRKFQKNERLACQLECEANIWVKIPQSTD